MFEELQADPPDELAIPGTGGVRDAVVPVIGLVLFALLLVGGPLSVEMGWMTLPDKPSEGSDLRDPGVQQASVVAGLLLAGMAIRLCYQAFYYGDRPFVFDRKSGQLRLGEKPLCALSEIREVRISEQKIEDHSHYKLFLIRSSSRPIGFGPFLCFGPEGAQNRKAQIEAFLGLAQPSNRPEPIVAVPDGVWDRQLDA